MTSTPVYHPSDDDENTHPEDQGDAQARGGTPRDLVDERTKELSEEEAAQHKDAQSAQEATAEDGGGYGH